MFCKPSLPHLIHTLCDVTMSCYLTGLFNNEFRTAQSSNSMASAEREPIIGSGGVAPSGGPGGRAPGEG